MQEAESWEPWHPKNDFGEVLNVDDAEHEDELVEDEVPEFVFHVLLSKIFITFMTSIQRWAYDSPVVPIFLAHRKQFSEWICQGE